MTTKLDQKRKLVVQRVKKFEEAAHEIHELAGKMHKKMQELHIETMATRERAVQARKLAQARKNKQGQTASKREPGKVG